MEKKRQKVGFYGGTFDPIHLGHIHVAVEVLERKELDRVIFCPAALSPHKQGTPPTPVMDRVEMARLALQGHPQFEVSQIEARRGGVSYTLDTLVALQQELPQGKEGDLWYLILGDDCVGSFSRWHQPHQILTLAEPVIASRYPRDVNLDAIEDAALRDRLQKGMLSTPLFDISATKLRKRLKDGAFCDHLVPSKVLDYIDKNKLYL